MTTALIATARRFARSALAALLLSVPVEAYVVDDTGDSSDANPGDSLCTTAGGGCTLRAAVEESNASPGMDWVQLDSKTYTRSTGGELEVTEDLGIFGPAYFAATIDAAGLGRVFHIHSGVSLSLQSVVVRGGEDNSAEGGAGIFNEGELDLYVVGVVENVGSSAAGIRNTGTLEADDSIIAYNGPGAALVNDGSIDMEHTDIILNDGVGLENRRSATLAFAKISNNAGGGILNYPQSVAVPASVGVVSSVLVSNTGFGALQNTGTAALRRSTVSGNRGSGVSAINTNSGSLGLEDVTIAGNGSATSPGAALAGGGTIRVINTIIGGNASSAGDPNCQTVVTSLGHNLMSCTLDAPDPTTSSADPRLAPLKEVPVLWPSGAGTTFVHPPLPGSPAIDAGTCIGWPDQRGGDRPQGGHCDIGAFETTPLCTGGAGMTDTRMVIRLSSSDGRTMIKVRGQLLLSDPLDPAVDPLADGAQLRIENAADPGLALVERTLRTEALVGADAGCGGGWRSSADGTSFRWKSPLTGSPCDEGSGQLKVALRDERAGGGAVEFKAAAKAEMPAVSGPLRVTIVFNGDAVDGNFASNSGACAEHVFACTPNATATKYKCE